MESPYSRKKRLNRERQQRFRARQDQEKIRQSYRASKIAQRLRKTPEQAQIVRKKDAVAHSMRRSKETTEQLQNHRQRQMDQRRSLVQVEANCSDEVMVRRHDCGPMICICQFCGSKNFEKELPADKKFKSCCHKGKVKLPKPVDIDGNVLQYPAFLVSLLTDPSNAHHKEFRRHIRSYNSAMSFASMGAQIAEPPGSGPYVFRIHGTVHHRTTHLNPPEGLSRKFAQLYVVDSTQAVEQRIEETENEGCCPQVMDAIDRFLRENNRLAASYQMIREIEERERATAERENKSIPVVNMVMRRDRQSDQRRYNMPTSNEIAMVFVDNDGEPPFERDIRIYPRNPVNENQQFVNINILSPNLDPMTYVILYPYGEPGWQPNWQCEPYPGKLNTKNCFVLKNSKIFYQLPGALQGSRTNVSMLQFKVAQTAIRNEFNPIISAGKLTQQWIVDSYLQVEANNLNFVRYKQNKLRAELYQGLADHVANVAGDAGLEAGIPIILPSSFEGSPRNMRERLQDAMSIFGRYGPPDLFITFTANPNWDEIKINLRNFEHACDRPDLVARVFRLKLRALIEDVTVNHVLGKCIAFVYTIEFQKRGLPHAHMLVVLEEEDKFKTSERIDAVVCAEIPEREQNPVLFEAVTKFMIHGPCGPVCPSAPCMENGECKKQFPKQLQPETVTNANGYPLYRRRDVSVTVGNRELDNRYVVPFNRYLLLKYNAHINTEICTSLKAVKYIYKYVYKGFDCANIVVGGGDNQTMIHDEIATFINARYVSAPEAMWRLLEFPMHDRSHAVIRLPVHLPNQQQIIFEAGHEQEALDQAAIRSTKLQAWFKLNQEDPCANQYLYTEIPHHYVFQRATWVRRQRGTKIVARMYTVGLQDIERFCLRLLLLHVPGATSFEYLRTINGVEYHTFKEAAFHLNLLSSDEEWEKCLDEAVVFLMPPQLRQTFALICVFCAPTNPLALWEKYVAHMCLDFSQRNDERNAINLALNDLKDVLSQHGFSCSSFGLPEPTVNISSVECINTEQESIEAEHKISTLNVHQLDAFRKIMKSIDDGGSHKLFYLNGPGGSGKTYLYNTLISFLRSRGQTVLAYATTGIAATLIKGGQTIHRGFKLPVPITETSVSKILQNSKEAEDIRKAVLIIMDEITMLSKHGLRCIDLVLRDLMACSVPFGGKVTIIFIIDLIKLFHKPFFYHTGDSHWRRLATDSSGRSKWCTRRYF